MFTNPVPVEAVGAIPLPDYDSGWFTTVQDGIVQLTHNLGGITDRYMIELHYRGTPNGEGESDRWEKNNGVHWYNLTSTTVDVYRAKEDSCCTEARLRIWISTS